MDLDEMIALMAAQIYAARMGAWLGAALAAPDYIRTRMNDLRAENNEAFMEEAVSAAHKIWAKVLEHRKSPPDVD